MYFLSTTAQNNTGNPSALLDSIYGFFTSPENQQLMVEYCKAILSAIAILIAGRILSGIARVVIRKMLEKSKVDKSLITFITSLVYFGLITLTIITAIGTLGVQTTSFVAIIGAAGLAIGLALQGSLSNFAAGVLLIVFKPFRVGDFIEGAGASGSVEVISIFTTELKTPDNKKVIIPNSKMTSDNITNYSANDKRRVDMVFSVSYSDDLEKVKKIINEVLANEMRILSDPKPTVGILALADSSVNFAVRPWVKTSEYWDVFFALQEEMKKKFDEADITIPFPQRDVHVYNQT